QAQPRLVVIAAGARDQAGTPCLVLMVGDAKAPLFQQPAGVASAIVLAARRIDRVEREELAGEGHGIVRAHVEMIQGRCRRTSTGTFCNGWEKSASAARGSPRRGSGASRARTARRRSRRASRGTP